MRVWRWLLLALALLVAGTAGVMFGTLPATGMKVISAQQITAIAPVSVASTVDVTVITAGGTSVTSLVDKYRYAAPPAITKLSASSGQLTYLLTLSPFGFAFQLKIATCFFERNYLSLRLNYNYYVKGI